MGLETILSLAAAAAAVVVVIVIFFILTLDRYVPDGV